MDGRPLWYGFLMVAFPFWNNQPKDTHGEGLSFYISDAKLRPFYYLQFLWNKNAYLWLFCSQVILLLLLLILLCESCVILIDGDFIWLYFTRIVRYTEEEYARGGKGLKCFKETRPQPVSAQVKWHLLQMKADNSLPLFRSIPRRFLFLQNKGAFWQ